MKVRTRKIPSENGYYLINSYDNFEYVNPIDQVASMFINSKITLSRIILESKDLKISKRTIEKVITKRAILEWNKELERHKKINLPENLTHLLNAKSKKEQISALKDLSLDIDELISFIFMAYENYGYNYSQYKSEHHHKGLNETLLPKLIHMEEDGTIKTIGETKLSKGEQKQVINYKQGIVAKFIDNKEQWHCFFLTYYSLEGKESYKNGQPHLHYISDKWNIDREIVKTELSKRTYKLPSLPHIDFHTYRNPRKTDEK